MGAVIVRARAAVWRGFTIAELAGAASDFRASEEATDAPRGIAMYIQEEVSELLSELASAGATVFFSSHVLSEVERMCHRVGIIRQGRMVAVEEVGVIKGRSLHIIEVTFAEPVPASAFDLPGVREIRRNGTLIHLEVRDQLDAALKAIARYQVKDFRTEQPSLDQVFLAFYQESDGKAVEQEKVYATA